MIILAILLHLDNVKEMGSKQEKEFWNKYNIIAPRTAPHVVSNQAIVTSLMNLL